MARKRPDYISPSGRFIRSLYRKYKRRKQYHFIIDDLPTLLDSPLVRNVSKVEPNNVQNVDYFSDKCDLQDPDCITHINTVKDGMKEVVDSTAIPPGKASAMAEDIMDCLKDVFKSCGYQAYLYVYGSYYTGLCTEDSDVDISFEFLGHDSGTTPKDIPRSIEKILRSLTYFSKVKLISNARVPFIRFIYKRYRKECSITFENRMALQNSKLIKLYLTLNPNLKTLTLYLKHLLNKYDMRGIGRITTHILFWLIVFFMQRKGLLPPAVYVRLACSSKNVISGTNCAVPDYYLYLSSKSSSSSDLYSLLLDFAAFYRDFKFLKYVMSPHIGEAYPIDQVENLKGSGSSRIFGISFINLQHPSDLNMNLAEQTRITTVNKFRVLCCHLSRMLPYYMNYSEEYDRPLDDILMDELPYFLNQPKELIQSTSFQLELNIPNRLTGYSIRSVRHLMENVLDFRPSKIVKEEVSKTVGDSDDTTVPLVYFSYSSTAATWDNEYISRIIPRPRFDEDGEPDRQINVSFISEIIREENIAKIMIESEAHFITFLDEHGRSLLSNILKNIYRNKRKGSFPVRYNPILEKLFFEIVNKIRTDANLHLKLEQPLPAEPHESWKTENNADDDIDEIVSNFCGLNLKNTPNKQDESIVKSVELISVSTKKAKDITARVINDLKTALKEYKFAGLKWTIYGSYNNGLCTVHSDTIDLSCEYGENTPSAAKSLVLKFSEIFQTHSLFRREEFYEDARVPIIKLYHVSTDKKVNITFFNDLAVRNVLLTKLYLSLNQDLKTLILYLKDLLMKYELHGKNRITTHVLFWLVVYFLQDKGLLPPVKDIRKAAAEKCYISGWNCSIPDDFSYQVKSQPPVSSLLMDFFVFYKDFNFLKYVISPYHGCLFPFEEFDRNIPIPKEARDEEVLQNETDENKHAFFRSGLNIQDPVVLNFNLTAPIRTDVINLFQVFCHRFVNDRYLPTKLPSKMNGYGNIPPIDLVRYASFDVFLRDIPTPWWKEIGQCVRMCVRRMMETIFGFELNNVIVEQNITRIIRDKETYSEKTNTVLYFDYCSTENTWKNDHVLGIFFGGVKPIVKSLSCKQLSQIYLICEIDREKKMVYVFVRSNDRLTKFLHVHFGRLMLFILLK
ncbi:uncharacterized protein LOC135839062 [Planococcus citri]|uniref:uncharacterized protein LOC135839062 n=1 Tax=Planococcus citri TaxID=170843 RepID=UPI0031F9F690